MRREYRHLVIVESGDTVGILTMRDIVRCWTQDGATSGVFDAPPPAEHASA